MYARAPAADAPIAADSAANSDSTMRYSQGASSPVLTRSESPSTMCVCGEIGYAAITSGRQSATAAATAWEPSICLRMRGLPDLVLHERVRGLGGGDVGRDPTAPANFSRIAAATDAERDDAADRGEGSEQGGVRQRAPEVLARDVRGRHGEQPLLAEALDELAQPELGEAVHGVDERDSRPG